MEETYVCPYNAGRAHRWMDVWFAWSSHCPSLLSGQSKFTSWKKVSSPCFNSASPSKEGTRQTTVKEEKKEAEKELILSQSKEWSLEFKGERNKIKGKQWQCKKRCGERHMGNFLPYFSAHLKLFQNEKVAKKNNKTKRETDHHTTVIKKFWNLTYLGLGPSINDWLHDLYKSAGPSGCSGKASYYHYIPTNKQGLGVHQESHGACLLTSRCRQLISQWG